MSLTEVEVEQHFKSALVGIEQIFCNQGVRDKGIEFELKSVTYPNGIQVKILDENNRPVTLDNVDTVRHIKIVDITSGKEIYSNIDVDTTTHPPENAITALTKELKKGKNGAFLNYAISLCKTDINEYVTYPESLHISMSAIKDQIENLNVDNSIKAGDAGIRPDMLSIENAMSEEAKLVLNSYLNILYTTYNDFCKIDIYKLFKHMTSGSDERYALTPHDINQLLDLFYFQNYDDIDIQEQDGSVINQQTSHTIIKKGEDKFFIQGYHNRTKTLEQDLQASYHEDGIYLQPKLTTNEKGYGHWTLSICKKSGTKYTSYTIDSMFNEDNRLFFQPIGNSCGLWTTLATTNVIKYGLDDFLYLYTNTTTPLMELCSRGKTKSTNIDFPLISECSDNLVALKRAKNFKLTLDEKEYSFTYFKTTKQSGNSYIYSYTIKDNSSNVLGEIQFEVQGPKFNTFSSFTYTQNNNKKKYTYELPREQQIKDFCSNPNNFLTTISEQITSWNKPDKLQDTKNELNRLFNIETNIKYKLGDNSVSNQEGDKFVQLEYTYDSLETKNNKISISVCDNSGQPIKLKDFNKNAKNYKLIITSTAPQITILNKLDLTSNKLHENIEKACNGFKTKQESKLIEASYNEIQTQLKQQLTELEKNLSSYQANTQNFNKLSTVKKNINILTKNYTNTIQKINKDIANIRSNNAKKIFSTTQQQIESQYDNLDKTLQDYEKNTEIPTKEEVKQYVDFKINTQNKIIEKRNKIPDTPKIYNKDALEKIQNLQKDITLFVNNIISEINTKNEDFKKLDDKLKKYTLEYEQNILNPLRNSIDTTLDTLGKDIVKQKNKEEKEFNLQKKLKTFNGFKVDDNSYILTISNNSLTPSTAFTLDKNTYEYTYSYVLKNSTGKDIASITLKLDNDRENIIGLSYKPKDKDKSIDYIFDTNLKVEDFIKNNKLSTLQNQVSNILKYPLKEKNITDYFESIKKPSDKTSISVEYDNSGVGAEKDKKVHLIYKYSIENTGGKFEEKSITIELYDKNNAKPITIETFNKNSKDYDFKIIKENNISLATPKEITPTDKLLNLKEQIKSMCQAYSNTAQQDKVKERVKQIYQDIEKTYSNLTNKNEDFNSSLNTVSLNTINNIITTNNSEINTITGDITTNQNNSNKIKARAKKKNFEAVLSNIQQEISKQKKSLESYSEQYTKDNKTLKEYQDKKTKYKKYIDEQKQKITNIKNLLDNTKVLNSNDLNEAQNLLNSLNTKYNNLSSDIEKINAFKKNLQDKESQINNTITTTIKNQKTKLLSISKEIEIQEKKEKKENDLNNTFRDTLRSTKPLYVKDSKLKKEYCYFAYNSTINEDTYQFNHIIEIEQDNKKFGNITLTLDDDRENITGFEYKKDNATYKHKFQSSVKVEEIINNTNNTQKIFNTKISTQIVDDLLIEENKDTIKDIFNTEDTKNITIDFIKGSANEEKDKNIQLTYINPNDKSKKIKVLLCDENNSPITLNTFNTDQKIKLIDYNNKNKDNILAEISLKDKNNYNKIFEDYLNKEEIEIRGREEEQRREEEIITRNTTPNNNNNNNDKTYIPPETSSKKSNGVASTIFSTLLGGTACAVILLTTPLGIGVAIATALTTFGITKSISKLFNTAQKSSLSYNYETTYQQMQLSNRELQNAINCAFESHNNNSNNNENSNNNIPKNLSALGGIGEGDNASEPPKTGGNNKPKNQDPDKTPNR